jgi:hypothetical protein
VKINAIKIDKTVNYPKSFYKKFKAEQNQYIEKAVPKPLNNCLIEEVDCKSSIMSLAYTEPNYKLQGKTVRKKIKAIDNRQAELGSTERKPVKINPENKAVSKGTQSKYAQSQNAQNKNVQNKNAQNKNTQNKYAQSKNAQSKNAPNKNAQSKNMQSKNVQNQNAQTKYAQSNNALSKNTQVKSTKNGNIQNIKTAAPKAAGTKTIVNKTAVRKPEAFKIAVFPENFTIYDDSIIEDEKCVIEEVDCKLSLVHIGYDGKEEEIEAEIEAKIKAEIEAESEFISEFEEDIYNQAEKLVEENNGDFTETVQSLDSMADTAEEDPTDHDINRFKSSSIVGTVMIYNDDKEDVEVTEEEEGLHVETDLSVENQDKSTSNKEAEIQEENLSYDLQFEAFKLLEENQLPYLDYSAGESINKLSAATAIARINQLLVKVVNETLLHPGAIHIKNILGFFSVLAFLGLLGIFTENKACLGFWAFLYYVRYFFVLPDRLFWEDVKKAALPAFFIGIAISILMIILGAVRNSTGVLAVGIGLSTAVSILTFTICLAVYQMDKSTEKRI